MIFPSAGSVNDVKQSEPDPQFTVGPPRVNPLAASSRFSLTKGTGTVTLDSLGEFQKAGDIGGEDSIVARIIARSRQEVGRRPNSARARTNLGIALLNVGQLDSAAAEFEAALKIDPAQYVAASNLARIKVEERDFEGAERIYWTLRKHYPNSSTPVVSLAYIAMRRQDYVNAERLLREAIQLGHRAVTARYHLAMVFLKLGKSREAISLLRSAARDNVRAPAIYEGLGAAYAVSNNFRRAAVAFKTALSLAPSSPNAVRGLAKVLSELGNADETIELLVAYLEKAPRDNAARQLLVP